MKKHTLAWTNTIICLVIIIGFISMFAINYQTYKTVLEDDIENISRLTSSHIYAQIDNELTKPIFVAQTMANDSFLKSWLYQEGQYPAGSPHQQALQEYLQAYRNKYGYDAVYMISAKSNVYYYFDGVNKTVSPNNEHDDWYYDFLASGQSYRLNIDTDEVNTGQLTIFVDCRVEASDGTLLGVTGVGVKMSRLQDLLRQHETDYDLQAFLVNSEGIIQADTDSQKIGTVNLFDSPDLQPYRQSIINNRTSMEMNWYPGGQFNNCLITRYIDNLDWYLVIQKNTQTLRNSFQQLITQDSAIILIILALLLTSSTLVVRKYNRRMVQAMNTDALTQLPNQQAFNTLFNAAAKESGSLLFLFDIDRFKRVNDTKGHLYGNTVLAAVAATAQACIGSRGQVARWGGDEFIGLLQCSAEEAEAIFAEIGQSLAQQYPLPEASITISAGITAIGPGQDPDYLLDHADQALYRAKDKGGNCVEFD